MMRKGLGHPPVDVVTDLQEGRRNQSYVVMIGAFPPPVHGMAAINAAVYGQLVAVGVAPRVIDIAATDLNRSLLSRLGRSLRVFRGLLRFARMPGLRGGAFYMSVSGGLGQIYEILFLLLARRLSMRIYLHHHSFAYLDEPSRITARLAKAAGPSATHITLSPRMAARLSRLYPAVRRAMPISNAIFLLHDAENPRPFVRTRLRTLGYLGNISAEKGALEFLHLLDAAWKRGLLLQGRLAGPFQDETTERQVRAQLAGLPQVEYVGPKYGAEKEAFFAGIDALVFPTRYANEAEPLVVFEALAHGLPVIAFGRGCIAEQIGDVGLVVKPDGDFVALAVSVLDAWWKSPADFAAIRSHALERSASLNREAQRQLDRLLARIRAAAS